MHEFELSADGVISFLLSFTLFVMLILGTVHELKHLKEKHSNNRIFCEIIDLSERARERLLTILVSIYNLRYVTLFVLCAMIVSTISPVSTLIEIEDKVVSNSCRALSAERVLSTKTTLAECKDISIRQGYSFADISFENTRSHFLQVALWPLWFTIYGFAIASFISFARKDETVESEREAIELLPHAHHVISILLLVAVGVAQNLLGS